MQQHKWRHSIEEVKQWADYINEGHTVTETAEKFGINRRLMSSLTLKAGLREPKRTVRANVSKDTNLDVNYFESIDSHEKAYILGLIFADGYIAKSCHVIDQFGIALQLEDQYMVELIKDRLKSNRKIGIYKNSAKLAVNSRKITQDLMKWGVTESKSYADFRMPNIDNKYINSFILGYFDGDGCATVKSTGYLSISICSNSADFLKDIADKFEEQGIKTTLTFEHNKNLAVLYVRKNDGRVKFFDYVYKDSPIFLTRKKAKIQGNIVRA